MLLSSQTATLTFAVPQVALLGIPASQSKAECQLTAADIKFPKGQVHTAWKPFTEMGISFESGLTTQHQPHLLVRWRLRKGLRGYHLALECLTIPMPKKLLQSMPTNYREVCEGPGAPISVLWSSDLITWLKVKTPSPPLFHLTLYIIRQPTEALPESGLDIIPWLCMLSDPFARTEATPEDAYVRR